MYSTELVECPGCRNACPADHLTCGIGEKIFEQYRKAKQAKQDESQTQKDSDSGAEAEK